MPEARRRGYHEEPDWFVQTAASGSKRHSLDLHEGNVGEKMSSEEKEKYLRKTTIVCFDVSYRGKKKKVDNDQPNLLHPANSLNNNSIKSRPNNRPLSAAS